MKRKTVLIGALILFVCAMVLYLKEVRAQLSMSSLVLENVVALAQGENDGGRYNCYGFGSLDCKGRDVAYIYGPYME